MVPYLDRRIREELHHDEWLLEDLERIGVPGAAFRTFEKHTHLDPNHRDEFDRALDRMPLTDEHHEILEVSAVHTARLAARAYRAIVQRAGMPVLRRDLTIAAAAEPRARRLHDPLRGATYEIGEDVDFLLARCDGRQGPEEVCRAFGERFGTPLERRELGEFLGSARAEHGFAEEGTA